MPALHLRFPPALSRFARHCALLAAWSCLAMLGGCAGLRTDPVHINIVDLQPVAGQGMEMRFLVKLRVQNPNEEAISFDGVVVKLDVGDKPFATGVSSESGSIARFGEAVIGVPVSVSAFALVRQAFGIFDGEPGKNLPYTLSGRLAGGSFGGIRFHSKGTLDLPAVLGEPN